MGIVPNRVYLVEGVHGSGKTTLALQFLLEGERRGEPGLYITLSETAAELIRRRIALLLDEAISALDSARRQRSSIAGVPDEGTHRYGDRSPTIDTDSPVSSPLPATCRLKAEEISTDVPNIDSVNEGANKGQFWNGSSGF